MLVHRRLIGPAILFFAVSISLALSESGLIPQLGVVLKDFFADAGLIVLPPIVILEYTYGLNLFFPGALTILFAMGSTAGSPGSALVVFLIIWLFSLIGCFVSYCLGNFEGAANHRRAPNNSFANTLVIFFVYSHPLTASIRSFQLGMDKVRMARYLSELVILNLFWNIFWGLVSYHYGAVVTDGNAFAFILIVYSVYWFFQERRKVHTQ